jgi:hypothetical protein
MPIIGLQNFNMNRYELYAIPVVEVVEGQRTEVVQPKPQETTVETNQVFANKGIPGEKLGPILDIGNAGVTSVGDASSDIRIWAGDTYANRATAPFRVDKAGNVTATSGSFPAPSTIAGFDVGADYIRDIANSFGLASTVTAGDDVRFWAGATFANRATAPFRVTESGTITATSAVITALSTYTALEDITALAPVSVSSTASNIENTVRNNFLTPPARGSYAIALTSTGNIAECKAANHKLAVIEEEATKIYVIAGTVNPITLVTTWGSKQEISADHGNSTINVGATYLADDTVMFSYVRSDGFLYARVATLSGTTFTFGTEFSVYAASTVYAQAIDAISSSVVAIGYQFSTSTTMRMQGLSVSGTTITAGATVDNTDGRTTDSEMAIVHLGSGVVGAFYATKNTTGKCRRYTFSSTTPTETGDADYHATVTSVCSSASKSSTTTAKITFADGATRYLRHVDLSGVTPSYGTRKTMTAANGVAKCVGVASDRTYYLARHTGGEAYLFEVLGTTTLTELSGVALTGGDVVSSISICLINSTKNRFAIFFNESANTNAGGYVYEEYDNTATLVGIAKATAVAGASVTVYTEGAEVAGFTVATGSSYYIDYNTATLTTTITGVKLGFALNTTTLKIDIDLKNTYLVAGGTLTASGLNKIYHKAGIVPRTVRVNAAYLTSMSVGHTNGTGSISRSVGTVNGYDTTNVINVGVGAATYVATISAVDKYSITFNGTVAGGGAAGVLLEVTT